MGWIGGTGRKAGRNQSLKTPSSEGQDLEGEIRSENSAVDGREGWSDEWPESGDQQ
jgi:hypothetical protein